MEGKKTYARGLDNGGNIEGIFILRLPSKPRGSRAGQVGEHAPVRADDGVDEVGGTW